MVTAAASIGRTAFWTTQTYPETLREMKTAGLTGDKAWMVALGASVVEAWIENASIHGLNLTGSVQEGVRKVGRRAAIDFIVRNLKRGAIELSA